MRGLHLVLYLCGNQRLSISDGVNTLDRLTDSSERSRIFKIAEFFFQPLVSTARKGDSDRMNSIWVPFQERSTVVILYC